MSMTMHSALKPQTDSADEAAEPWNVLHVTANHEKRVAQHLAIRGIDHYLPLYSQRSQWTDRRVTIERPLFRGYVFVRQRPTERIAVISVPGVIRLIGDGQSHTVSYEEVERIREGLRSGLVILPHPEISVGKHVRIRSGVFAGIDGTVTDLRRSCKVVISLQALRQNFSLEIAADQLEILD